MRSCLAKLEQQQRLQANGGLKVHNKSQDESHNKSILSIWMISTSGLYILHLSLIVVWGKCQHGFSEEGLYYSLFFLSKYSLLFTAACITACFFSANTVWSVQLHPMTNFSCSENSNTDFYAPTHVGYLEGLQTLQIYLLTCWRTFPGYLG